MDEPGIPIPPGSERMAPWSNTTKRAWMWYASCSVGPQLIPLTRPVPVVDVEPIGAPCSSGTPSKPTREAEDELLAAVEVGAVEVDAAVEVDGALEVAAGGVGLGAGGRGGWWR